MTQNTLLKNKLVCTVTGKVVSVAPKVFDERAKKYGSAELLRENYIGAVGRKLLCTGKTVNEIRSEFNVPIDVPWPAEDIVSKYIKWAKYRKNTTPVKEDNILDTNTTI